MGEKNRSCIAPKGILKSYITVILSESPMHGYAISQRIEKCTGFWRPSPGAVYPMLSIMEKEGIVRKKKDGTRFVYSLTASGRRMAENAKEIRIELRERIFDALSSVMTRGGFAKMNKRLVEKIYGGKQSFDSVMAANSVWVLAMEHFYTRQDERRKDVEQFLNETETRLKKMLNKK